MNILLTFSTILFVLLIFRHIEKNPFSKIESSEVIFSIIILFLSYIYNPVEHIYFWIGWSVLLYTLLDDLKTKSLRVDIPIFVFIYFIIITFNFWGIISSLISFIIIYLLYKLSKGKIISDGDAYIALPLAFFIPIIQLPVFFYISFLLGGMILLLVEIFQKNTSENTEYPFVPFLFLGSFITMEYFFTDYIIFYGTILFFILYFIFYFFFQYRKKND